MWRRPQFTTQQGNTHMAATTTEARINQRVSTIMEAKNLKSVPQVAEALGVPKTVLYAAMKADRDGEEYEADGEHNVLEALEALEATLEDGDEDEDFEVGEDFEEDEEEEEADEPAEVPAVRPAPKGGKKGSKKAAKAAPAKAEKPAKKAAAAKADKPAAKKVTASKTTAPVEGAVAGLEEKPESYGEMGGRGPVELATTEHGMLKKQRAVHSSGTDGEGWVVVKKRYYKVFKHKDGTWRTSPPAKK